MDPAPVVVLANPRAGAGRRYEAGGYVAARLTASGHRVRLLQPPTAAAARTAARGAVAARPRALVVVGGDGMAHLGANAIRAATGTARETPLGIVPTGTGNDIATALGFPRAFLAATDATAHALATGRTRTVDSITVTAGTTQTHVLGVCALGFDAMVNERANTWRRPPGRSRYIFAAARELPRFAPIRYHLTIDAATRDMDAMLLALANTPSYGGGMRIAPHARLDDGLLDLVIVHPVSRFELLRVFPRVFTGAHIRHPAVEIVRCRTLAAHAMDRELVTYADGERLTPTPLHAAVAPASLHVLESFAVGGPRPGQ